MIHMALSKEKQELAKNTKLSENFTLLELLRSTSYPEYMEYPRQDIIDALRDFAINVLQPIRDKFGPINVTSGFRNPKLNKAVGGVTNSIHQIYDTSGNIFLGVAADIIPQKADLKTVFEWAAKNVPAIKNIIIYRKANVTRTPFIHVDTRAKLEQIAVLEKTGPSTYVNYTWGK